MKLITHSVLQTQQLGKNLAKKYQNGGILALFGDLGSGKTTFTQGFAEGLKIKDRIISPTFILMRQYSIPSNTKGKLFHIDLYRLDKIYHIEELGLSEIFTNRKNIILIEWAGKLRELLPKNAISIHFRLISENSREILIK